MSEQSDKRFNKLFQTLPVELQSIIFKMHLKLQPKLLLDDLQNYVALKDGLFTIYRQFYLGDHYSAFYWFRKDLMYFCNSCPRHEITPQIATILNRQQKFDASPNKTRISKFDVSPNKTQISLLFALLLPHERTEFNDYVRKTFFSNFPFTGVIN